MTTATMNGLSSSMRIKYASSTPRVFYERITPAAAQQILDECNTANREMSETRVNVLLNDYKSGRYVENGDTIRFDIHGNLLDGQHRLRFIALSGAEFVKAIAVGLPPQAFTSIDTGKSRTLADLLGIAGHKANAPMVAATARMHSRWTKTGGETVVGGGKQASSTSELVAYAERHPEIMRSCAFVAEMQRERAAFKGFPRIIALSHCLFSEKSAPMADDFVVAVVRGDGLGADDPYFLLRGRLIEMRGGRMSVANDNALVAMCVKAWNAKRSGTRISLLRWKSNESMPTVL